MRPVGACPAAPGGGPAAQGVRAVEDARERQGATREAKVAHCDCAREHDGGDTKAGAKAGAKADAMVGAQRNQNGSEGAHEPEGNESDTAALATGVSPEWQVDPLGLLPGEHCMCNLLRCCWRDCAAV